jgi:hypothetical protein
VIATRADDRNRLLADFRKCARAHLTGQGSPTDPADQPAR